MESNVILSELLEDIVDYPSAEEEARRQEELTRLGILDSGPEATFDQLVKILAATSGCSAAWITFVDNEGEWSKASVGIVQHTLPRESSPSRFVHESHSVTILRFPLLNPSPLGQPVAFYAGAPIRVNGVSIGTVAVMDAKPKDLAANQTLTLTLIADHIRQLLEDRAQLAKVTKELADRGDQEQRLAEAISRIQSAHLDLQAQGAALTMANARLQVLAETDGLTSLRNRRALFEEMNRRIASHESTSVIMLDLDNFKAFNDRHGHIAGDEALRILSDLLSSNVRGSDIAARYGGEEFVLLLGDMPGQNALDVAERLRRQVESYPWQLTPLTISAGTATIIPGEEIDPETLIERADSALYAAKRTGKNRVLAWVSG